MKLVVLKESAKFEKRVGLSPEVTKKLVALGHEVVIEKEAGVAAGFMDTDFESAGGKISMGGKALVEGADLIVCVSPPQSKILKEVPRSALILAIFKPFTNKAPIEALREGKATALAMEFIPRLTRAQAMDVLSSQSNLAGYKAVIDAVSAYGKAIPMMMTAAGTIHPAKIFILGAGVAGLQAIATARRLGAIVSAFDIRSAVKEQVESLGASFVEIEGSESGEGLGGYAKEMSKDHQKRQAEKLATVLKTQDIVITTALIPGKKAPLLITKEMIRTMKPGSIILDLATEAGGNTEGAKHGATVDVEGVKIIAPSNILSLLAYDASQVYARNIFNLIKLLLDKDGKELAINWDDEILMKSIIIKEGEIVHPSLLSVYPPLKNKEKAE